MTIITVITFLAGWAAGMLTAVSIAMYLFNDN